jgi:hypothetical protein
MQRAILFPAGLVATAALCLSVTACRGEPPQAVGPASTPSSSTVPSPPEQPATALVPEPTSAEVGLAGETVGPCDHLLWPLRDGASWTYQFADGSQITLTSRVTGAGALLTVGEQSGLLNCLDGALAGLPPGPFGTGHPTLGYGLQGLNPSGSFLPAPALLLPLGTSSNWDMGVDAAGTILLSGLGQSASLPVLGGKIVFYSVAEPPETITVLAGTYHALPVSQQVFYDIEVSLPDGSRQQAIVSTSARLYFVERLGLAKIVFEGGVVSTPAGTWELESGLVLELVSYAIP